MKIAVRSMGDLGNDYVLAPERHCVDGNVLGGDGVPLGELVRERRERIDPTIVRDAVVIDTSHARDGLLDVSGAIRDEAAGRSAKKRAAAGDLVISRLRPYLRQIALVHPSAVAIAGARPLALSTEFYVLAPREPDDDLAFLVPFLLSDDAQSALAAAQEGGHHPRVPWSILLAMRVPRALVEKRVKASREIGAALADAYRSSSRVRSLLGT